MSGNAWLTVCGVFAYILYDMQSCDTCQADKQLRLSALLHVSAHHAALLCYGTTAGYPGSQHYWLGPTSLLFLTCTLGPCLLPLLPLLLLLSLPVVPPGYWIPVEAGNKQDMIHCANSTFRSEWVMFNAEAANSCTSCGDGINGEARDMDVNPLAANSSLARATSASCCECLCLQVGLLCMSVCLHAATSVPATLAVGTQTLVSVPLQ